MPSILLRKAKLAEVVSNDAFILDESTVPDDDPVILVLDRGFEVLLSYDEEGEIVAETDLPS